MILEQEVSAFSATYKTDVAGNISIAEVLGFFKNGRYKDKILELRGLSKEEGKSIKTALPTFAFHGVFERERTKANFIEASGIIILDIDGVEKDRIEEAKIEIMNSSESVLAVMRSPSGNGIKVLYYVVPETVTADSYRAIGKRVIENFSEFGEVDNLSITDCLIATYDPKILINEDVEADYVYIKEVEKKDVELEPLDKSRPLWEDAEDFFETVLSESIAERATNNFHYIQIACFELAKFGFYHPEHDLSFVVHYSESCHGMRHNNGQRFKDAAMVALDVPQTHWAYKTFSKDIEEEESFDYDQYIQKKDGLKDRLQGKESVEKEDVVEEEERDDMVQYENIFHRVMEVIREGDRVGAEISLKNFAEIFRFKGSGILTVTGIPGHGKTEFVDACLVDLARLHGHHSVVCGFEQTPEEHMVKLMRKMIGTNITNETYHTRDDVEDELKKALSFVTQYVRHIESTKTGGNVVRILEAAAKEIKRMRDEGKEVKYFALDPFNMLTIKGRLSGHEKIEEILRRLTEFSHKMGVMVILVAHPFKMKKDEKTGQYEVPDFYSVKGSSAFFEMSYHGLVVYRTGNMGDDIVEVKVLKVKQNNLGEREAIAYFTYQVDSGRYNPVDEEGNELSGDHRENNWLENVA